MNRKTSAVLMVSIILIAVIVSLVYLRRERGLVGGGGEEGGGPEVVYYGPGMDRHLILGNDTTSIHFEVDYVQGYGPSQQALDALREGISTVTGKSVSINLDDVFEPQKDSYTREDLENLENTYRDHQKQEGSTVWIYVLCLNGVYNGSSGVLGVAYNGTSFAIMEEQIDDIDIPRVLQLAGLTVEDFESSVMVHEMGHLFGLVNIGYESERNHEDPDHPHHCDDPDCVMYWALETSPAYYIQQWLNTGNPEPPTTFCDDCLFDIQQIAEGLY